MAHRVVTEQDVVTGIAGEDLSRSAFRAVVLNADGRFVRASGLGDIYGILEEPAGAGGEVTVFVGGIHEALTGGAFDRGARLASDFEGRLSRTDPNSRTRTFYFAEEASTGPNQTVTVRREVAEVGG